MKIVYYLSRKNVILCQCSAMKEKKKKFRKYTLKIDKKLINYNCVQCQQLNNWPKDALSLSLSHSLSLSLSLSLSVSLSVSLSENNKTVYVWSKVIWYHTQLTKFFSMKFNPLLKKINLHKYTGSPILMLYIHKT